MNRPPLSRSCRLRCLQACAALTLVSALAGCTGVSASPRRSTPHPEPSAPTPSPNPDDGYLRGVGGSLVDSSGRPVRLVGVSWFGFETSSCALHGLSVRNWRDMLSQISGVGFNVLRLPYSNQFLDDPTCVPTGIDYRTNPDLRGLRGLALMDRIVNEARRQGLWVILDRHAPTPDARTADLWYSDEVPQSQWIDDWVMLARHYGGNRAVIGADIANEPHGTATWGDGNPRTDWRLAAERAGNAVLAANPDWLIIVQGIEDYHGDYYWWGGNLEGARDFPVRLSQPDKLVYSIHDYGPEIYWQSWFSSRHLARSL